MSEWTFYVRVRGETAVDSGDGLTFTLHGRDGQAVPAPAVYLDGTLSGSGYTFNPGGPATPCSITFATPQTGRQVTCDYRWKNACAEDEEAAVFEIGRDVNIHNVKDANGRDLVAIGFTPVGSYKGLVRFEYVSLDFWREWQRIVENAWLFDLERASDNDPPRTLDRLLAVSYPRFAEIPGIPDRFHMGVEFIHVAD